MTWRTSGCSRISQARLPAVTSCRSDGIETSSHIGYIYRITISQHDNSPTQADFERLLELRIGLRRFLRWSEQRARAAGLTPTQHQLLLAIRGHPEPAGPTVGEVADYLVLRHHSAVELIDRAATDRLVTRTRDPTSRSLVRVTLTPTGIDKLDALAETHLQELAHLAPTMRTLWQQLEQAADHSPHPAARQPARG
jgi:DNA-binding MarR family transcriptional regulator